MFLYTIISRFSKKAFILLSKFEDSISNHDQNRQPRNQHIYRNDT